MEQQLKIGVQYGTGVRRKLETSEKIESSTELESSNVVPTKRGDYKN